ncbi:lysylphosphatidylglycerol synthase transmembrane domain-containing protein [Marinifilum sp.]|uniref:lysylphosphatidylglycerol synthase transmembrane domain-containing protein n=1 Tax=Marinifilum sp. TaxID=2033137 RepID=UPI003BAD69A8
MEQIKDVNLAIILAAAVLFILSKTVAAYRLLIYFRSIDVKLDHISNLKLYLLGMFYNLFLPGGIGGDGYKIYLLKKQGFNNVKRLIGSSLVDRLSGLHALFCLLVIIFVLCPFQIDYKYAVLLLIPVSYAVYYLFVAKLFPYLKGTTKKTFLYSLIVQSLQLITAFLLLTALGQSSNLPGYLFLFLSSSVVAALPLTIGGIGGREFTAYIGADLLHLNVDIAIAVSLYFYIITAIVSFAGIYYMISPFEKQFHSKELSIEQTTNS